MADRDREFRRGALPSGVHAVRQSDDLVTDVAATGPLDWIPWVTGDRGREDPALGPSPLLPPPGPPPASTSDEGVPSRGDPPATPEPSRWSLPEALVARLPMTLRGGRLDPSPRGAAALAVVSLLAALLAAAYAWRSRPSAVAVPAASIVTHPSSGPGATAVVGGGATPASPSPSAEIVVDVAGKVRRPGVVRVPAGSRVVDAVAKAGGVVPGTDTTGLALAQRLTDGEEVLVTGRPGQAQAAAAPGDSSATGPSAGGDAATPGGSDGAPVNLNTATETQLDGLPGVGPVLAQRILQYREQHGSFTSTRQLGEVEGLGDKRLAQLLPLVTV